MSLLVGQDGTGWSFVNSDGLGSQITKYLPAGYVAVASGTMSLAHVRVNATGTATKCRIYVYLGTGAGAPLVAFSSEIDISGTGDRSAAISGSITGGQAYTLVYERSASQSCSDSANNGASAFANSHNTVANFPYASPPGTLPSPDTTGAGAEIVMWIDGTVGIPQPPLPWWMQGGFQAIYGS